LPAGTLPIQNTDLPELPEVETIRRGVERWLPGHKVRRAVLRRPDLRWPIPRAAFRDLIGRRCEEVTRRSKYLLIRFSGRGQPTAMIHLGMSGQLLIEVTRPREPRPRYEKHEHWRLDCGDRLVRFMDPRRFGSLDVVPTDQLASHRLLAGLGPEPLDPAFDGTALHEMTRGRKVGIKSFLMNAKNVVGIGNIYASEICFLAGVRPRRSVRRLTHKHCKVLAAATREILEQAIREGGTSLRDYVGVEADTGYFQQSLSVYGRVGETCDQCDSVIKQIVESGRSSFYCPRCQS